MHKDFAKLQSALGFPILQAIHVGNIYPHLLPTGSNVGCLHGLFWIVQLNWAHVALPQGLLKEASAETSPPFPPGSLPFPFEADNDLIVALVLLNACPGKHEPLPLLRLSYKGLVFFL